MALPICPEVLGMTKCSIAFGHWPHAIEHLVIPSTSGQIVSSIAYAYIVEKLMKMIYLLN
jgi:hypothetical protein